ncbi:MAG: dihydrofolate reductase [Candidatus Rifleibacteriota bacterium]
MIISIIAARDKNNLIGNRGKMPWHIPEELALFKKITMNKTLIMGRKTFEGIGKALPGRKTIVLTRQPDAMFEKALTAESMQQALKIADELNFSQEVFIAGGESVYHQALVFADRIYLSTIEKAYEGDKYFPEFSSEQFKLVSSENFATTPAFTFNIYVRNAERKNS